MAFQKISKILLSWLNPVHQNTTLFFKCAQRADGIHTLLKERKIGKEHENELYELIGQQDKRLAAAYVKYKDTGQVGFQAFCPL